MTFKKITGWLHLWLGLSSGIVVFILALTGCILVFEHEIESLAYPWLHAEQPKGAKYLPPSVLYQSVHQSLPDKIIHSVWYGGQGKSAYFTLNSDSLIYVNPYTGNILAMVDHEDFFNFILEGHTKLWLEKELGETIIGYATLVFFFLLITGIILWIPKKWSKASRDKSFKIKWRAKFKRVNYDLHNVMGFYALLIALLIAFTGLTMSFPWFSKSVYWISSKGESAPLYPRSFSDTTLTHAIAGLRNVDIAWKMGMDEIGVYNKDQIIVSFPKKHSDPIYVCTDMKNGSWRDVYMDQHTLRILPATQAQISDLHFGQWLRRTNYTLHVGAIGGFYTKILYFLASLICATLPVTGFYIWWGRRKKGKKKNRVQSKTQAEKIDP